MRRLVDAGRIEDFMQALGREADQDGRVYFTGGVTAVLMGWRQSTIDIDLIMVPESDRLLRALPMLKESLEMNVELACPSHFIPELPGWAERSPFVTLEGRLSFHHYDLYAQCLAKIERGHAQDVLDVHELLRRGLVEPSRVLSYFEAVEHQLYRYPAIDPGAFRLAVEQTLGPYL